MNDRQLGPFLEVRRLLARVEALEAQIESFRRERQAYSQVPQQVRWCVTTSSESFPIADTNVFQIKFIDAHFTAATGVQALTKSNRSGPPQTFAHAATGRFVPEGVPLPCFWLRGLGANDAGEWWLLDPPMTLFGKLAEALVPDGEADMTVWLLGASGWEATDVVLPVKDWFLRFSEEVDELEAGHGLAVDWYLASGANAKYVVREASCLPTDFFE